MKIQRDWRNRLKEDAKKFESLMAMWDREKANMREYYMTNGGANKTTANPTKKNKLASNKLVSLSDEIKVQMLKKYLLKSKTEFHVCFIEHRLDLNPSNFNPSIYQYLEELKRNIKVYEKELTSGVKATDPVYDWISSHALVKTNKDLGGPGNNNDIFISEDRFASPTKDINQNFSSAVIHASVQKNVVDTST